MSLSFCTRFTQQPWLAPSPMPKSLLDEPWREWLLHPDSLTQKLRDHAPGTFELAVLSERQQRPTISEAQTLGISPRSRVQIREVVMSLKGQRVVFARTVIPMSTLTGFERQLRSLNNKPLGEFLFTHPAMERQPIEVKSGTLNGQPVWGRRSIFNLSHKPLLVSEFFLPDLFSINR